ncbi:MAG: hypothetical protein WEE36_02865 [Acidimicrobiia bacterium]
MSELSDRIRKIFDESAPPLDVESIADLPQRPGKRTRTSAIAAVAGISIATVAALWLKSGDPISTPMGEESPTATTRVKVEQSTTAPYVVDDVLYLGLERAGWVFALAGEASKPCAAGGSAVVSTQSSWLKTDIDGTALLHLNLSTAALDADCGPIPQRAADLGPPASPPDVVDHGSAVVLGEAARVIQEGRVIRIFWLWNSGAGKAEMTLIPGKDDPTLSEAISIVESIVALSPIEWATLLVSPRAPTTTDPG